jgi:dolichol kinase
VHPLLYLYTYTITYIAVLMAESSEEFDQGTDTDGFDMYDDPEELEEPPLVTIESPKQPPPRVENRPQRIRTASAAAVTDRSQRDNADNILYFEKMGLYGIMVAMYSTVIILVFMGTVHWLPMADRLFWLYISIFFSTFFIVALAGGILVRVYKVDVMYTRKTIHFFSFFLPFTLPHMIPFEKTLTTYLLIGCALFLAYAPLIEGVRKNVTSISLAFASFDRKQDRPFTLFWAVTQNFAAFVVMVPISIILAKKMGHPNFITIPIMTVAIGDGVAEIVGRKWGYHKYISRAILTQKEYTRSIEGSMCVFLACLGTILFVAVFGPGEKPWAGWQITIACMTIPLAMTIVEAIAPHSWDNALLLSCGGIGTIIIFTMPEWPKLWESIFLGIIGESRNDMIDVYSEG